MTARLDSGFTPEQEAFISSLPRRQRLWLLALDVGVTIAALAGFLRIVSKMPPQ